MTVCVWFLDFAVCNAGEERVDETGTYLTSVVVHLQTLASDPLLVRSFLTPLSTTTVVLI